MRLPQIYRPISMWMLLLIMALCIGACKKDLLQWDQVEQIGPFSDGRFNQVLFVSDQLGFVVGGHRFERADLLVTRDGGRTWQYRTFPEAAKGLYGITQTPTGLICIVGFDGKLLTSADDGYNWTLHQLSYLPTKTIIFNRQNEGFVAGGVSFDQGFMQRINHDGVYVAYDSVGYEINEMQMINGDTGYLVGYGVCMKTTDGGDTWSFTSLRSDNFTAVDCPDLHTVWVCGYEGSIYKSEDAGVTWQRKRNGNQLTRKKYRLLDIHFVDAETGYVVGENGVVLYSDDGGNNWMEFASFTDATLRTVTAAYDGSLLVAGDNGAFYRLRR